jgi:hypothetical protein
MLWIVGTDWQPSNMQVNSTKSAHLMVNGLFLITAILLELIFVDTQILLWRITLLFIRHTNLDAGQSNRSSKEKLAMG